MAIYYIPSSEGWASQKASNTSVPSGAARLRVKVDRTYNQSTNISTLVFSLEMYSANYSSSSFVAYDGGTFTSQGTQATIDHHYYVSLNADTTWRPVTYEGSSSPATWTRTVQHDSDGNATITAAVNFTIHYTSSYRMLFNNSGSFSVHEARMSDVSASNGYFGNTIPITVTRKSNAFTHNVRVVCLGQTTTIATGSTASSLSWSPAVATYAPLLTGNMSTTATIYCDTYNGSTLIGTRTASITMSLKAADVAPSLSLTIEDATVSPPDATKSCLEYYGAFVATKSKFKITTVPTLAYGASVAATSISANGATYNSSPATTGAIVNAAQNTVTGRIVDSRGQAATDTETVTVLPYTVPLINAISVHRCQQDGTLDDGGAYCRVDYDVDITALNNHNSKTLKVGIKKVTDANYTETTVTLSAYSATGYVVVAANTEFSHDVRISLIDDFSTTVYDTQISSAYVRPLNFRTGGLGIGIGKVSEYDKTVDLAADWTLLKNGQPVPLSDFYNDSGFVNAAGAAAAVINDQSASSGSAYSSNKVNSLFASGTNNGWVYFKIGSKCIAFYFNQITAVNVNSQWVTGTYRSGELWAAPFPSFLASGYKVFGAGAAGSQDSGIDFGRIFLASDAIRVYLTCTQSKTNCNFALMVVAVGDWTS